MIGSLLDYWYCTLITTGQLNCMVSQKKIYKSRVISPEEGRLYPSMELGQAQELRLLQTYVDDVTERVSIVLGQFLRSLGCLRVEPLELEFRALSPAEQGQWVWCAALAPLDNRSRKMFRFGVPRAAAAAMTEATLGLNSGIRFETSCDQPPSETERRFLSRLGDAVTQGIVAENSLLRALDWQQQSSSASERKGLCLKMRLVFQEQSWPLTLYWHMAFADLLERLCDRRQTASSITRSQLESSLEKIPVQLKTTLLSTRLTMAELESFLQGEILPVSPLERVTLGCGSFSMGMGQIYDRNGYLVFQLHDASQQTS